MRAPRTRGWTGTAPVAGHVRDESPAHAGMDRLVRGFLVRAGGEPRARGDGPAGFGGSFGFVKRAPRTRGWTVEHGRLQLFRGESPAHAGMDRTWGQPHERTHREPRARGDGPEMRLRWLAAEARAPRTRGWAEHRLIQNTGDGESPAHAGMDRLVSSQRGPPHREPRARGDGPLVFQVGDAVLTRAPRMRGWTVGPIQVGTPQGGSPAHAGVS